MGLQGKARDPAAVSAREGAARYYQDVDQLLADREYLAGPYSYADIAFYMAQLFGDRMGAPIPDIMTNVIRWRTKMTARPAVRHVVGPMAAYLVSQGLRLPAFLSSLAPTSGAGAL